MKVLVIGATGLLGKPVVEKLVENGYDVRLFSRSVKKATWAENYETMEGDVMKRTDITKAMKGCDAIHISISNVDEAIAVEHVVNEAKKHNVKLISYVSGCSVCEENRNYWLIDNKLRAERVLRDSGIPHFIYKPTWFFESLSMMIRHGKATVLGKKLPEFNWVAASDLGRIVVHSYKSGSKDRTIYIYGPEKRHMKDLLEKYCHEFHPEIKRVSVISTGMLKFIGTITKNQQAKLAAELFSYFEKVEEPRIEKRELLPESAPDTTFEFWINSKKNPI
ncbi:MAG: NAD(P)H-binding protein [Bacteroidales bacterium]|nr:NAD(P)H-binding protein [Bacteroidales bacterium]